MTIKDQLSRVLHFSSSPTRIVSLVPSQTELIVSLGLRSQLVGLTKFCIHPEGLIKEKTVVGGTKQIHIEDIKALRPDIILCNKEENTKAIVAACEDICPVHISNVQTLEGNYDLIKQYGVLFNKEIEAASIIAKQKTEFNQLTNTLKGVEQKKVVYLIWRKPYMTIGNDTFINYLLEISGFDNVFANKTRYPEVQLQELKNLSIDYVFLSSEPYPFKEKHFKDFEGIVEEGKLIKVDGEYFSWYGSRLLGATTYFKKLRTSLGLSF
jgi:ABC-type Fe3+-hydroxamate transport system substrate-binding protein